MKSDDILKKSLEEILEDIELIKKDLTATKIVQSEKSHYETYETCDYDCKTWIAYSEMYEVSNKIIDVPEVRELDHDKIEIAKKKLHKYYVSSSHYSAKYVSAMALGQNVQDEIPKWFGELEKRINYGDAQWEDEKNMFGLEVESEAVRDAFKLFELSGKKEKNLIENIYQNNKYKEIRREAGELLGYSRIKLYFHELMYKPKNKGIVKEEKYKSYYESQREPSPVKGPEEVEIEEDDFSKGMPGKDYDGATWIPYG